MEALVRLWLVEERQMSSGDATALGGWVALAGAMVAAFAVAPGVRLVARHELGNTAHLGCYVMLAALPTMALLPFVRSPLALTVCYTSRRTGSTRPCRAPTRSRRDHLKLRDDERMPANCTHSGLRAAIRVGSINNVALAFVAALVYIAALEESHAAVKGAMASAMVFISSFFAACVATRARLPLCEDARLSLERAPSNRRRPLYSQRRARAAIDPPDSQWASSFARAVAGMLTDRLVAVGTSEPFTVSILAGQAVIASSLLPLWAAARQMSHGRARRLLT
jgi:hypothetical protein